MVDRDLRSVRRANSRLAAAREFPCSAEQLKLEGRDRGNEEYVDMKTITAAQFRDAFRNSVSGIPATTLRRVWNGPGADFTCLMKYDVLVRTARSLGLNSAQEFRDIDSVFYEETVEDFSVAVEHENNNKSIY